MTLFQVILKLIKHFNLMDTEARQALTVDVEKYDEHATPDNPDKIKALYGRIHQGIYVKLAIPFLFFGLVSYLKRILSTEEEEDFLDD